jgi:hypothetical protein
MYCGCTASVRLFPIAHKSLMPIWVGGCKTLGIEGKRELCMQWPLLPTWNVLVREIINLATCSEDVFGVSRISKQQQRAYSAT